MKTNFPNRSKTTPKSSFMPLSRGLLQRKCACGGSAGLTGECSECEQKKLTLQRQISDRFEPDEVPAIVHELLPLQTKLKIGNPDDIYEREADRVATQVMSMSNPSPSLQGETTKKEEIQTKRSSDGEFQAGSSLESRLNSSQGSPLPDNVRSFMEPRFGADFSQVRVHTDSQAVQMNRELNAQAFTYRQNIYFGAGKSPGTDALTAHELTHVVQQGAVPSIQNRFTNENSEQHVHSNELYRVISDYVVQRFPGDGMKPPGDCNWATYLLLRGSVETAKAVVSTLGACSAGDSCLFLATKIAAISAEIAARVALDTTCFKGGDTGHRQQVQDKINMMNRCYRFFSESNCSPELIEAMAVVVERAREVIAAGAVVVSVALVVALIAAIIALAEVIAALAAAAAEGAAIGAAAAAVIALLVTIKEEL